MEEHVKVPVFKASLIYGIILGLATIVINLLLFISGQSFSKWVSIAVPIINVVLMVLMLLLLKKEYGKGYITFGNVVFASFIIGLTASILFSVYNYALYSFDQSFLQDTKYEALDRVNKRMEKQEEKIYNKYADKMTDDQLDTIEERMDKSRKKAEASIKKLTPLRIALTSIIGFVFWRVIIGLISGLIIKKDPEPQLQ